MTEIVDVSRIRSLNDDLRRSLAGGVLMMTAGVIALESQPMFSPACSLTAALVWMPVEALFPAVSVMPLSAETLELWSPLSYMHVTGVAVIAAVLSAPL